MDINEYLNQHHAQFRNECFQRELQQQAINASAMQNQITNARLVEINESLQKQIDEAKQESESATRGSKASSVRSWISIGIAGVCGLLEIISIILKACHIL